jgi:DNA polymerase III delta subunit
MVYLFIGQDNLSKDVKLTLLKEKLLSKGTHHFNLDTAYGRELTLQGLQELLLFFPAAGQKRMVVVKEAGGLKKELKDYLVKYAQKPQPSIELVLDIDRYKQHEPFIRALGHRAQVLRFQEEEDVNTFSLGRQIELKRAVAALGILKHLLKNGERPEQILGGLRASWEKYCASSLELKQRLKLLLACDIEIKTGKLKADVALEKAVVQLCSPKKFL